MASTPQGRRLTERHRAEQVAIRTRVAADVTAAWSILDPADLDKTTPAWLAVMLTILGVHRRTSAHTAADYFAAYRHTELDDRNAATPATADPGAHAQPDRQRAIASLLATGPVAVKAATARRVTLERAQQVALTRVIGATTRHALDGGRETLRGAVADDPKAVGWARVTDGSPCAFCAMVSGRGPVYKTKHAAQLTGGGDAYHDHCACTVEPVYSYSAAWPGQARQYEQLWKDATAGLSGDKARAAFRRAIDQQRVSQPVAQQVAQPQDETRSPLRDTGRTPGDAVAPQPQPEQLSAATLAALSDEDLSEAFAVASNRDIPDEVLLVRLLDEMDRRDGISATPADPLDGVDLTQLLDGELFDMWQQADNGSVYERIAVELDRRDREYGNLADDILDPETAPDDSEQAAETLADLDQAIAEAAAQIDRELHVDALIAKGYDYAEAYAEVYAVDPEELRRQELAAALDVHRQAGETRDQAARRLYDEWVALQYLSAEHATRGFLLNPAGVAAGIDPRSLWGGTAARARKYASEELARWWETNVRKTFTEFRAEVLGRTRDVQQASNARMRGNGRDFGL